MIVSRDAIPPTGLSAKVRLVERVRGFKELADEKSSEGLKMTAGLDWPCRGSEFILSKAEETLRYAVEKERRRGKLSSDYWFARVGRCRHRVPRQTGTVQRERGQITHRLTEKASEKSAFERVAHGMFSDLCWSINVLVRSVKLKRQL